MLGLDLYRCVAGMSAGKELRLSTWVYVGEGGKEKSERGMRERRMWCE